MKVITGIATALGGFLYVLGIAWCFSENPPIFPGLVAGAGAVILLPALAHYLESRGSGRRFPRRRPKIGSLLVVRPPEVIQYLGLPKKQEDQG